MPALLAAQVLSVDSDAAEGEGWPELEEACQCSTVFELAGPDRMGLLADVVALLRSNGCEVRCPCVGPQST